MQHRKLKKKHEYKMHWDLTDWNWLKKEAAKRGISVAYLVQVIIREAQNAKR